MHIIDRYKNKNRDNKKCITKIKTKTNTSTNTIIKASLYLFHSLFQSIVTALS